MKIPTLLDIEAGADVFLNMASAKDFSPVDRAAYNEFMDGIDVIVDCEWHLQVIALLLTGRKNDAHDYLINKIAEYQPEPDSWGDAADRGNDARVTPAERAMLLRGDNA